MKTPRKTDLSTLRRHFQIKTLALAAGLILPVATGLAQNYWQGPANGSADYNTAADWVGNAVPTGGSANPADDNGSNSVILIQTGDPAWSVNSIRAGWEDNDSGSYLQTGGSVTAALKVRLGVGNSGVEGSPIMNIGSAGYYTLNGGTLTSGSDINIGEFGAGGLTVNGGTLTCNGNFADNDYQWAASNGGGTTNTESSVVDVVTQTGGLITVTGNNQMFVGNGGPAIYNLSGGTNNVGSYLAIGRSGGYGTLNMTGGLLIENGNNGGNLLVGSGYQNPSGNIPSGDLNQSGGIINCYGGYFVPESSPALGTNVLDDAAVLNVYSWLCVGRGSYGEMDISGSAAVTHNNSGSHIDIGAGGSGGGGAGVINQNGGSITDTNSDVWLGEVYNATWNMNAGTATLANLVMSEDNGVTSTLNLNGGVIQASSVNTPSSLSLSTLNLNGGTLQANENNSSFINGVYQVLVGPGGAVFDSQAYNITIPEVLQDNNGGAASVTKLGSGTLILPEPNTFGGNMTVSNGLLEVSTASSGGGAVVAENGAGFGTLVSSADSQLPVASLTVGGASGGTLFFDLGGFGDPSTAPLGVSGAFTANGTITVNVAATVLSVGTVPLVQYGSLTGTQTFVLGTLPAGVVANLAISGGMLELVVTSAGQPRWNGNVTGDWDLGTNQDWYDLGTMQPTIYRNGEPVLFDDNASGTTTVDLTATVSPASINFNNNAQPYAIVGTGQISGSTGLNVNGPGTVAIQNTGGNNFTGPVTVLASGILSVTNLANGGSPSAIGASSANRTNLVINDGILSYGGPPVTINRSFTVGGTNSTIDAEGNLAISGNVTAVANATDGGSALTKYGPAQLAFTGSGDNEFSDNYSVGLNVIAGTLLFDGSAGNQTNHTQNQMYIGSTVTNGASLVLTNTILNVDSWLALGRINGGIGNTSTITLYNSAVSCGNLSLGWDGGQPNNLSSQFITLNGNSTLTNYGNVNLAEGANASATININGNSVFWVQNPFYLCLANNTTDSVVVANSGKIVSVNGWFDIGNGNNCVASMLFENNSSLQVLGGDLNLADTAGGATSTLMVQDSATVQANTLWVGKSTSSTCSATFSNSASAHFNTYIDLASGSPSTGTLTLAGGSVTDGGDMTVGDQGTGVLNMVSNSSAVLTVNGTLYLSRSSQVADGTVNLNSGTTIVADYVNNGWGFHSGYSSPLDNPNAFNFNGGTLKAGVGSAYFIQPYVNAVVQPAGAIIDDGGFSIEVLGALVTSGTGNGGLTKLDTGTLRLDGVNTYTGPTLVSSGTLVAGPGGVIAGPVTVASGATLAGDAGTIETYSINNSLTLSAGSTMTMSITPSSNDQIAGLTSVQYGGALVVTNNSGSPLSVSHTYQLFNSAVAGTGNFSSVTILPSGGGTFNPVTGVLTITSSGPLAVSSATVSGGNLILTGTGGTSGGTYSLLTATNLATPVTGWITNTTGVFTGSGGFSNAIPVNSSTPAQFFRLKTP